MCEQGCGPELGAAPRTQALRGRRPRRVACQSCAKATGALCWRESCKGSNVPIAGPDGEETKHQLLVRGCEHVKVRASR